MNINVKINRMRGRTLPVGALRVGGLPLTIWNTPFFRQTEYSLHMPFSPADKSCSTSDTLPSTRHSYYDSKTKFSQLTPYRKARARSPESLTPILAARQRWECGQSVDVKLWLQHEIIISRNVQVLQRAWERGVALGVVNVQELGPSDAHATKRCIIFQWNPREVRLAKLLRMYKGHFLFPARC